MAALVAFYDANVLYPAELRNFLMYLATSGLFRAKWSNAVHEEWISNLLKNRPDLTREKPERTRMRSWCAPWMPGIWRNCRTSSKTTCWSRGSGLDRVDR